MNFSKVSPQIEQIASRNQCFNKLPRERRIFSTPWHWYVHGLGIGQEASGFKPDKADRLLETSLALFQKTKTDDRAFTHHLLDSIISTCAGRSHVQFTSAIEHLPSEPWQYARACALLAESLGSLGLLEAYRQDVRWHLGRALEQVSRLDAPNDKLRYEKLQLFANLLLAAGQAGFADLLALPQQNGDTYADIALQVATTIDNFFYRGRGSAIIFSVLAIVGCQDRLYSSRQNHLQALLDSLDEELSHPTNRNPDGVHEGSDYYLFPLSLILNAIAVLDCPEYLTYKKDWVKQSVSLFHSLSPASQASQISFFIHALNNLGVLDAHVPDAIAFFTRCMEAYLESTDGARVDDYLRCTYLIHLAYQLGRPDLVHPRLLSIFWDSVAQTPGSERYLKSTYGSSYMVAAYALSAFERLDRLDVLFGERFNLPNAIALFKDDPAIAAIHSPRTAFALIDLALQMRPS
jgi:hypothetical protein